MEDAVVPSGIEHATVRQALRLLRSERDLALSPLCSLTAVAERAGESVTRGAALRSLLEECLERLKPPQDIRDLAQREKLEYAILTEHYIQGRNYNEVLTRLHISKAELYRRADSAISRLIDHLLQAERAAAQKSEARRSVASKPRLFVPPRRANQYMVGRDGLLASVREWLSSGRGKVLALYGPAGIGKSALAAEIANDDAVQRLFEDGTAIFELGANPTNLRGYLESCAVAAGAGVEQVRGIPTMEGVAKIVRERLHAARVLFVLDDVCDFADFSAFDVLGPNCAMILTTRTPRLALQIAGRNSIQVTALSPEASLELLALYAPDAVDAAAPETSRLAERLGGLPVALVLTGHYLLQVAQRQNRQLLRRAIGEMVDAQLEPAMPMPRGVAHGTDLLASVLEAGSARLSVGGRHLLVSLGVFAQKPVSVSERMLMDVAEASIDEIDELIDASFLEPAPGNRYTTHQSFYEFALAKLRHDHSRGGIWRRFADYVADFVSRHRLDYVAIEPEAALIHHAINVARDQNLRPHFISLAADFAPFLRSRGLGQGAALLLTEAFFVAEEIRDDVSRAQIANELCQISFRNGLDDDAEHWAQFLVNLPDQSMAEGFLPFALEVLSVIAQRRGDIDEAVSFAKKSVAQSRHSRHGGVFDRQLTFEAMKAEDVAKIAGLDQAKGTVIGLWQKTLRAYLKEGNLPVAYQAMREALTLSRQLDDPLYIVHTLGHLALGAYTVGNYPEAIACADEAADLMPYGYDRTMLPTRGYAFTSAYGRIAQTLYGQYDEAVRRLEESIEFGHRTQSPEHLSFAYHGLAASHYHVGRLDQAYVAAQHSLAFAQQLGSRDTVVSPLRACGYTAVALRRVDEGIAYLEEARKIAFEVWTPYYVDIELGIAHTLKGDHELAERLLRNASDVLRQRGATQFRIKADFGLARVLAATGRGEEARRIAEDVLATCVTLGDIRAGSVREWLACAGVG